MNMQCTRGSEEFSAEGCFWADHDIHSQGMKAFEERSTHGVLFNRETEGRI